MILNVQLLDGKVVVTLKGKIYVEGATLMRESLFRYIEQGHSQFVFDLSDVAHIDSSGLGVFVAVQKKALQNGGGAVVKGLQGEVKELFEQTRLTRVFVLE